MPVWTFGNVDAQLSISQKAPEQLSELLEMDIDSPEFQKIKVTSPCLVVNSQKLTRTKIGSPPSFNGKAPRSQLDWKKANKDFGLVRRAGALISALFYICRV